MHTIQQTHSVCRYIFKCMLEQTRHTKRGYIVDSYHFFGEYSTTLTVVYIFPPISPDGFRILSRSNQIPAVRTCRVPTIFCVGIQYSLCTTRFGYSDKIFG